MLHLELFVVSQQSRQNILIHLSPGLLPWAPFKFPDKFVFGHWSQGQSWGGKIDNELILCFIPWFSLPLSFALLFLLCLLIVHVTMSITQLLISFGLRNSSVDLSEAAGWKLPSMTGALCVYVPIVYRKTPTHRERAPLDSQAESLSNVTVCLRTLTVGNFLAQQRWFLTANCTLRYGIFQGALFLIGSPHIELETSLLCCFVTSSTHPYKLNDMDFTEFNFNEIAGVRRHWNRLIYSFTAEVCFFFSLWVYYMQS